MSGPLLVFSQQFLVDNGYELYDELPELQLKIYKNKEFLLGVDFQNANGSVHLIKNKKNFDKVLEKMKENFAGYLRKKLS